LTNSSGASDNRCPIAQGLNFMRGLRRILLVLLIFLVAVPSLSSAERARAEAEKVAQRVLERAILIDTHADTPQMLLDEGYDLADPDSPFMISIPKMREGHLGAEFFSIWVSAQNPPRDLVRRALDLIDVVSDQVTQHSDTLEMARTADDIVRIHRQKKIAVLMGLEGGHIIQNDLRLLDIYYRLGVRYLTLTHSAHTDWADSSEGKPLRNGLTDFGRQIVQRMSHLGMMVDVSHVSDKTFHDTLAVTQAPIIASHSSCRALVDIPRNMSDDMIRALAKNGGVMQVNFYSAFIDQDYAAARKKVAKQMAAEVAAARREHARAGKPFGWTQEMKIGKAYEAKLPVPSFERIADHIDHVVKVAGVDHVGLGSDFDGIDSAPRGMEDVSRLPNLVRELARRGYSEEDLEKIVGGNLLRVMRQVEEVARRMQAGKGG
jgi:membrane dipeptidase